MKRFVLLFLFTAFLFVLSTAQSKVANFFTGKYGTENYEQFSFWVKEGKRADIDYTFGVNRKDVRLKYLGKNIFKGDSCFKVQFPNNYILYIIPTNKNLKITDESGKYLKIFRWEYEGPINGIGTFCDICVENEDAAMQLIRLYYLK